MMFIMILPTFTNQKKSDVAILIGDPIKQLCYIKIKGKRIPKPYRYHVVQNLTTDYLQNTSHVVLRNRPGLSTGMEGLACLNNLSGVQLGTLA